MAFTREGRVKLADHMVNDATMNLRIRLAKAVLPAGAADEEATIANVTEATFDGYAEKSGVVFPAAVLNGADHGETLSPTQHFVVTGGTGLPQTIYAYYIVIVLNGTDRVAYYRSFPTPIVLSLVGHSVDFRWDWLGDDGNVPPFGA